MESVQSLLARSVARIVRPAALSPEKVLFAWRVAVGPAVSRVTRVRLTGDRVLDVQVDDDRFGDELARGLAAVLGRLQDMLGADQVRRIALRRPEKPTGRRQRRGSSRVIRQSNGGS